MARKRMIDPSFWTDEKIGECTPNERLLFIGLVSNADDEGYGRANPKLIKSSVFPYDDFRASDIQKWLSRLGGSGMVVLYSVDGQAYYYLPNFSRYQSINKPTKSLLPKPSEWVENDTPVVLPERYRSTTVGLPPNRKEEKGIEENRKEEREMRTHAQGKFSNVVLSDTDFAQLQKDYPNEALEYVERLSLYLQTHKKKQYDDHYALLVSWIEEDRRKASQGESSKTSKNVPQKGNCEQRQYPAGFFDQFVKKFDESQKG